MRVILTFLLFVLVGLCSSVASNSDGLFSMVKDLSVQPAGFDSKKRFLNRCGTLRGCQRILKSSSVVLGEFEHLSIGIFKIKTNAKLGAGLRFFGINP